MKHNWSPPRTVVIFKIKEQFNHEAIEDEYDGHDQLNVRFDFEFRVEIHLSQNNQFQDMSCEK